MSDKIRQAKGTTAAESPFRDYLATVREDTDSLQNRSKRREQLLRQVLDGVFDPRDTNRAFNATQRRILWHASTKKRCSVCKEPIVRWEDLTIDHVRAHVKGGRTTLANAALAHRSCNAGKGAR